MSQHPLFNLALICVSVYGIFLLHFYITVSLGKAHSSRYHALAQHFLVASLLSGLALVMRIANELYTLENAIVAAMTTVVHILICTGGYAGYKRLNIAAQQREWEERESVVEELTENYKVSGIYSRHCEPTGNTLDIAKSTDTTGPDKLAGT